MLQAGGLSGASATLPSAVEDFAAVHDQGHLPASGIYRHPLPLRAPERGEQYAFEVDLDACTGCKACVTACHSLNGLDPDEAWRHVALLIGADNGKPILQHVTTSCHHCANPGCLTGCPANAYEKDPRTGIVRHLDDRCIGCRYCTFTCPYGAPQYVPRLGIVRKCDMCADRLSVGEAPACVQGCPNGAIRITLVTTTDIQRRSANGAFLPQMPHPRTTLPASLYRKRGWPAGVRLADTDVLRPEEAHWPLAWMLVLTQLSVGRLFLGQLVQWAGAVPGVWEVGHAALSATAAGLALGASLLHLGRPLLAWRAVLGLGHSWLSREVIAFGMFAACAAATAAIDMGVVHPVDPRIATMVRWAAVGTGGFGLFASAMLYRRTVRPLWRGAGLRFSLTAVLLGAATTLAYLSLAPLDQRANLSPMVQALALTVFAATLAKLAVEMRVFWFAKRGPTSALGRSARLIADVLYPWTALRFFLGWLGGVVFPLFLLALLGSGSQPAPHAAVAAAILLIAGELIERGVFFRAAVPAGAEEVG